MALYQNPEFQEDQSNSKFRPEKNDSGTLSFFLLFFLCKKISFSNLLETLDSDET